MCCGRETVQQRVATQSTASHAANPGKGQESHSGVTFQYAGITGMTVMGPVSGRQYRFSHPGARVEVDPRDRVLLASLRQLRQLA
jgi:hypothetical protein